MKNLAGIRANIDVDGPPKPKSSKNSDGSTVRDIKTLSTLEFITIENELPLFGAM